VDQTVATRIGVVLTLVAFGWLARRTRLVDGPDLGALSRLVVDFAFPALVLVKLWATVDRAVLLAEWYVPVSALVVLPAGWWIGQRLTGRRTDAFLIGLPNWIFLPLLICEALFGDPGVRTVLLFNAGAQLALWTMGIATLTGQSDPRQLLRNPGLWATVLGIGGALLVPGLGALARNPSAAAGWLTVPGVLVEGLGLMGTMAIPLTLCVTGAQLGGVPLRRALRPTRRLWVVLGARLVLLPLLTWAALLLVEALGVQLDARTRLVVLLTAAMPVAISGAVHARRFGGDADLAAQSVLWSTTLSLATVPLIVRLLN
jgi:hypothetical protein